MKIKTVTTYISSIKNQEDSYRNSYIEYNSDGNVIEATEWSADEEIESKTTTVYDVENKVIEECNYLSEDEISERFVYSRNPEGRLLNVKVYYADGSFSNKNYEYDPVENTRTINILNEEEDFEGKEFYRFDKNGNIIEKEIYTFSGSLEKRILYTFEDSKLIKEDSVDETGNIISTQNFTYDDRDNLIEIVKINSKNIILEKLNTVFDEKNRIVEQTAKGSHIIKVHYNDENHSKSEERFNFNGQLVYFIKTIYNEKNLIIEEQTPANIVKYHYIYFGEA